MENEIKMEGWVHGIAQSWLQQLSHADTYLKKSTNTSE